MQTTTDLSSLYTRFGGKIRAYLRRLTRDDCLAEDLTQQTFLQAARKLDEFRGEGRISNWLYRIATNVLRDHQRKAGAGEQLPWEETAADEDTAASPAAAVDPSPLPPQLAEKKAVTQCVHDCIEALPPRYRAALVLYSVEGRTVDETATILGCSAGVVKVRLHRARRLFKELAERHCEVAADAESGGVTCLPKSTPGVQPR